MLPPIVRRLFSAQPIVAPLLLIAAITTLFLGFGAHQHVVPAHWVGGSGVGGAAQAVGAAKLWSGADGGGGGGGHGAIVPAPPSDSDDDADDNRLPPAYAAHFPGLQLPASLDAAPALAARLRAFLRRPVEAYDEARAANEAHCPVALADQLVNPDQLREEGQFWRELGPADIVTRRAELVNALADVAAKGGDVLGKQGRRGIVMTAGNRDTVERLLSTLRLLKKLEVDLPIEVFHYPDELTDAGQRRSIEELGATLVEAHGVSKTPGQWKNWQIKPLAMIQSSLSEILYLDSDNMPLRNPSHLFTASNYAEHGRAAFWPDVSKDHTSNAVWRVMGETCSLGEWTFESGQMLVDKAGNGGLNLAALHIAAAMLDDEHGARAFWLRLCGGDKDTFRWAFHALDLQYVAAPRWMAALGFVDPLTGRFCGHTTLQYDLVVPGASAADGAHALPAPPPLFVHANLLKHLGGGGFGPGAGTTRLFSHVKRMALDDANESSLNYARMSVYTGARNMCLDLAVEAGVEADEGGLGENHVQTVAVEELPGRPFEGFEELFFESGGRVGGWGR